MGFWKDFFGLEQRALKTPPVPVNKIDCQCGANSALSFSSLFGRAANPLSIAAFFRCMDLLCNTIAQLPIRVKNREGETYELTGQPLDIVINHDRNNELTTYQMIKNVVRDIILKGNGFILVERHSDGSVKGLRYLESQMVTIHYDKKKRLIWYTCPELYPGRKIEDVNMLHFRMYSYDGITGVGLVKYMTRTIGLANDTDEAVQQFYRSGMNLNGVLSAKNLVSGAQLQQIKEAWNTTYNSDRGGLIVLPNNLEYQAIQSDKIDGQNSSREYNAQEIAQWFGISPILIGILTHSSGYSFEQARLEFLSNTIMSWVRMMEEELNRKLLRPSEENLLIDIDETQMLRADKATLVNYYTGLLKAGILTTNECRNALGYNAVDGGDKLFVAYTDIAQNTLNNNQGEDKEENK